MKTVYTLINKIQPYAWGSINGISDILGIANTHKSPMAELWMGSHPACPSSVYNADTNTSITLDQLLLSDPDRFLGEATVAKFGATLPYLFKVLSASRPLSLQVHPTKEQAEKGFKRENLLEIPLTAAERNYKDSNHKPEIMLALTPFTAMCGFRPIEETISIFSSMNNPLFNDLCTILKINQNYETFLKKIIHLSPSDKSILIEETCHFAKRSKIKPFNYVLKLAKEYPFDIGILSPLYLNILELKPGEALFLESGIMHSYIKGTGLELMANSDNVLRGGLTQKHIDTVELLSILNIHTYLPEKILPTGLCGIKKYITPSSDFELSLINLQNAEVQRNSQNPSIVICTEGEINITSNRTEKMSIKKGESIFISAQAKNIQFNGSGKAYMASLPEKRDM